MNIEHYICVMLSVYQSYFDVPNNVYITIQSSVRIKVLNEFGIYLG